MPDARLATRSRRSVRGTGSDLDLEGNDSKPRRTILFSRRTHAGIGSGANTRGRSCLSPRPSRARERRHCRRQTRRAAFMWSAAVSAEPANAASQPRTETSRPFTWFDSLASTFLNRLAATLQTSRVFFVRRRENIRKFQKVALPVDQCGCADLCGSRQPKTRRIPFRPPITSTHGHHVSVGP